MTEINTHGPAIDESHHVMLPIAEVVAEVIAGFTIREQSVQWGNHLRDIPAFVPGVEVEIERVGDDYVAWDSMFDGHDGTCCRVMQGAMLIGRFAEYPVWKERDVLHSRQVDFGPVLCRIDSGVIELSRSSSGNAASMRLKLIRGDVCLTCAAMSLGM